MTDLAWMRPRLAELAGVDIFISKFDKHRIKNMPFPQDLWAPDLDVAQAIQVLEALGAKGWRWAFEWCLHYDVQLQAPDTGKWTRHISDGPLPGAICLAIVDAMGWEAP